MNSLFYRLSTDSPNQDMNYNCHISLCQATQEPETTSGAEDQREAWRSELLESQPEVPTGSDGLGSHVQDQCSHLPGGFMLPLLTNFMEILISFSNRARHLPTDDQYLA